MIEEVSFPFGSPEYRQIIRDKVIDKIDGRIYASTLFLLLTGIILIISYFIPAYTWYLLPLLCFYFLIINVIEYLFHRYLMHKKTKGMEFIYEHVTVHHGFFADKNMYMEDPRDYYPVILPPLIFIGITVLVVVIASIIFLIFDSNAALFFALVAYSYYFLYEILHFSYHCKDDSILRKLPFVKRLSHYHHLHHQVMLMAHYNFNITFPIADIIFRTQYKGPNPDTMLNQ